MELNLTPAARAFIDEWNSPLPYVVAHTSGSTGKPKEIRLLKSDMRASARACIEFFNLTAESLLYLPLSPDYIAGKMQIVRALEAGCSLTVEEASNRPLQSVSAVERDIDLLPIVPSQIEALLSSPHLSRIKAVIIGGAPITSRDEEQVIKHGLNAYATYGMTETCSHVALRRLGESEFSALPPFSFSTDYRGCLVIDSDILSFGRLVTNDIVELIDSRHFIWQGRIDNIINSAGLKICPEEIERQIAPLLPPGTRFYITSRPSERWGEEAVMVTDSCGLPENLIDKIKLAVGTAKTPKAIIHVDKIKLTDSQKIIREKF